MKFKRTRWVKRMALLALFVLVASPAFAQDSDQVSGIATAVVGVIAFLGTMVARWTQTNPANPWYVRLARVFDVSQVFDSTRSLGDE